MERLPIALHLPQDLLPLSGSGSSTTPRGQQPSKVVGSGAGYGPPLPADGTPLSRLVSSVLYVPPHEPTPAEAAQGWQASRGGKTEYDLVAIPLTNGNWQERWERMCTITASATEADLGVAAQQQLGPQADAQRDEAESWREGGGFLRNEVNITRSEESGSLISFASDWLELDSPVEGIRFDAELALRQEISYASYLSIATIVLPPPKLENREFLADYARAINGALASSWHINISIRLPIAEYSAGELSTARPGTPAFNAAVGETDRCETWEMWNTLRGMCSYSPRLTLTLDLSNPLPPSRSLTRWAAEPVKHMFLPCTSFIPNAKGYPVLSKSMQAFLKSSFKFRPTVILSGTHRGLHAAGGHLAYAQYVRFLYRKSLELLPVEEYAQGYMDHLQQPLQPLMDNLEGETYEGFEKDPIKYRQYEEAVYRALMDRPQNQVTTIFVVGAGRGPLVAGCLRAAERSQRRISLTAVEKNPAAFVILQERSALEWGSQVKLVYSDMRSFQPQEKADIIVSELLGSFGDNELSPECLDGVMRTLKPDGISIPASYTSYLAPISTSRLHTEVTNPQVASASTVMDSKPSEQPYVVMFSAFDTLSSAGGRLGADKVQECWTFDHPRPDVVVDQNGLPFTNHHNARSAHLTFHIPRAGVCHGFAGYFEAVLYADVMLSIHPERAAGDMLSWFPIFFPLGEPVYLPANSELDVQIWRLTDNTKRRVWFEWAAQAYLVVSPALAAAGVGANHRISLTSPPGSATSGSFSAIAGRGNGALSPQLGGSEAAFASAPSPHLGAAGDGRMPGIAEEGAGIAGSDASVLGFGAGSSERIKISQTRLHNPGGKTSWIGL
ncbi:protein arginine N-methyltransferase [Rhodotorula paludigena]|uniref:protein arginine N-methyltransferase n=1 Tax=Rhodotorula paludigena TaxID=86838 RepID=UPI00316F6775